MNGGATELLPRLRLMAEGGQIHEKERETGILFPQVMFRT